ncbi:MAG: hypothetical protein KGJ62_04125 [Armatimonadetes bacterium]|nr:hypothetical protein [Armatimonadota bacterium]MDE2205669.1 hypothetical protein [Armatimonadota bacterium]
MRSIVRLWLPLAISYEMMMMEGPTVQAAMGRLPAAQLNLAAFGLAFSLSLLVESPVIMMLPTTIALVSDKQSWEAMRRFTLSLCAFCTALTALVAFTPLFGFIAQRLMGQPVAIVSAAQPVMRIMLFWSAVICWRRFCQGTLVKHGITRYISVGTAIRILTTIAVAGALVVSRRLPGAEVGGCAVVAAVTVEAFVITLFAWPVIRDDIPHAHASAAPLTQRAIIKFHAPLAATTVLNLLGLPLTAAALGRLAHSTVTLAAWPVVAGMMLVVRGWGIALQEISVAVAPDPDRRPDLRRFAWLVAWISFGGAAVFLFSPLVQLYLVHVVHVPLAVLPYAKTGAYACILLPVITAVDAWRRGMHMAVHRSRTIYQGMAVSVVAQIAVLVLGVAVRAPGMLLAAAAFTSAIAAEYLYLTWRWQVYEMESL